MPKKGNARPLEPIGDLRDPEGLYHCLLRYCTHLAERNYSPNTIHTRTLYLRFFIQWCDDRSLTRPHQLTRPILERYQKYLFLYRKKDGDPLSVRSQASRVSAIRHYLHWATRQGIIAFNPAFDLELPRQEHRLPKHVLSSREVEVILGQTDVTTVTGLRDRAMLETFYSTGMRRQELINLTWVDIDSERGTVMIRQGKGRKDRMIPIGERALAWIEKYRDTARPELASSNDDGSLFLTHLGEAFTPGRLTQLVRGYVDAAKLGKRGSCHLFRHTMATLLLENGADIRVIQALLGHAELNTTQIYAQVSIRLLKAVHSAAHPAKLGKPGQKAIDAGSPLDELLATLEQEAHEDGE